MFFKCGSGDRTWIENVQVHSLQSLFMIFSIKSRLISLGFLDLPHHDTSNLPYLSHLLLFHGDPRPCAPSNLTPSCSSDTPHVLPSCRVCMSESGSRPSSEVSIATICTCHSSHIHCRASLLPFAQHFAPHLWPLFGLYSFIM